MNDDEFIHPLVAVLPDVAAERSGAMTPLRDLFYAVNAKARASEAPTIPIGALTRLLRRLGYPVLTRRGTDGARKPYVRNLMLHAEHTNGAERHKEN